MELTPVDADATDRGATLLERWEALRDRSENATERLRAAETEVQELLAPYLPPNPATATIILDERGLIAGAELHRGEGATPRQIRGALNDALTSARLRHPRVPAEAVPALLAQARGGEPAPRTELSDSLGQLTVTAQFGDVIGLTATDSWVSGTPDAIIAEEVVRLGRQAAITSDAYGRFRDEEEGQAHG